MDIEKSMRGRLFGEVKELILERIGNKILERMKILISLGFVILMIKRL